MEEIIEYRQNIEKKYKNQAISVSNSMIRSRENTNLLESKIEALAVWHTRQDIHQKSKTDTNGEPYNVSYVILPASEIKELMGRSDGGAYKEIKNVAIALGSKVVLMEDKENHRFVVKKPYGDVAYDDGKLYIEFEPSMEKYYFRSLKNDFTMLKLPILFSYRKNGGFQLYRLLRSRVYPPNLPEIDMSLSQEELPSIDIKWNVTDLRMQMGFVDIDNRILQVEGAKKNPDWEKVFSQDKQPRYKRWGAFNDRVIDPGVKEINEIGDIYIKDVIKHKSGKGAKITGITFVVQHNKKYYEKHRPGTPNADARRELSPDELDDFLDDMRKIFKEDIKLRDLKAIAAESGYDLDRVRDAYNAAENAGEINNITGWMIAALKNGYSSPVRKAAKKDFQERVYDYSELEKKFFKN